jgi:hypothetical protein
VDRQEAQAELSRIVAEYRTRSYEQWASQVDAEPICLEVTSPTGRSYQVEIEALWDHPKGGDIRVLFGIDDGGWRAFAPLTEDFVIRPDGTFAGE